LRRSGSRRAFDDEKFLAAAKICSTLGSTHPHCKGKTRFAALFQPLSIPRDGCAASAGTDELLATAPAGAPASPERRWHRSQRGAIIRRPFERRSAPRGSRLAVSQRRSAARPRARAPGATLARRRGAPMPPPAAHFSLAFKRRASKVTKNFLSALAAAR